jgi:hypothetical protein
MDTFLRPSPEETDAAAWLDRDVIKAVVQTDEENGDVTSPDILAKLPNTFRYYAPMGLILKIISKEISTSVLH